MKRDDSKKTALTKEDISDTFNEFFGKVIEPRFDRIESYIQNQIEPRFDRIESYVKNQIEPRFDKIDKKLEEHDKKFNDLLNHFDQIYNRLDHLETEYFAITAGLQRVEKQLLTIEEKLDKEITLRERLEKEVSDLKQRVSLLQREIEEIEIRLKTTS
jgi:chromosome segregation ATPase